MSLGYLPINLLGTSFTIQADEAPQYLQNLLDRYRGAVEEARTSTGLTDNLKLAILAGIIVSDQAEKASQTSPVDQANSEVEKLALDLIARIDEALATSAL